MKLVVAEKPSVAMSIAKVIGANEKQNGYLVGNGYMVSWCIGHLVSLAKPEDYDERYTKWQREDLPILPENWLFTINEGTKKQFKLLEKLMKSDEVKSIIEATDSGREGELIFRLVYNKSGTNKPFERLWISSMEDGAIKTGFENLNAGKLYEPLYQSALARSKADWLVGLNATRLFTTVYHNKLSVGRVQTPTLAMIVERDMKIETFVKEKFYHVELDLGEFKVKSERINTVEEADNLVEFCRGKKAIITEVKKDLRRQKPPKLFDLTSLQREANRLFGYTAKQTLDYTQSLYEKKLVTYPRTDSRFITQDMMESVSSLISALTEQTASLDINRIIDDKKVTDHHAIIPTSQSLTIKDTEVPKNEWNILQLIQTKLLAAVSLDYVFEEIAVKAQVEEKNFGANTKIPVEMGFKKVEDSFKRSMDIKIEDEPKTNSMLMKLVENTVFDIDGVEKEEGMTTPPKAFTEDTLLSAMEKAGIEELDESLEIEKQGLGTPATRAAIIEKLISTGYIVRKKKNLISTDKGQELIRIVPDQLKSAELTAQWENKLTEIAVGKRDADTFLLEIQNEVQDLVKAYDSVEETGLFKQEKEVIGKCPRCSTDVYEGMKNFYCANDQCKFSMWKEDRFFTGKKKTLTKKMATTLLSKGKVKVTKLYSEQKDKYYDAVVVLDDTGTWVNYKLEF